jgi:hypothetical protein
VLRDFAREGHQLLVFTCHEHVWRMFQELKIDSRRIPSRYGEPEQVAEEPQPVPEPVAEQPAPVAVAPTPKPIEAKPQPAPPVVEAPAVPVEVSQEVLIDEPVGPEHELAPALAEVEYRWDTYWSHDADGPSDRDDALSTDWLPETMMRPSR